MQKYQDNVLTTIGGTSPASGASVYVYNHGTQTLASIFSDGGGVFPLPNPLSTDTGGGFYFYAANGRYDLSVIYQGSVVSRSDVLLLDPANAQSYVQVGGTVDNAAVGSTTPAVGDFTNIQATGSVSGAGFSSLLASPGPIGSTVPNSGSFTSLTASGTVSGNGFVNLHASPGPIGSTTPSSGSFTTLSASGAVSGAGFTSYFASPPAIGGMTPGSGSFTSLSASGTVSGAGFSTYLASPPSIGGTAAASGSFTTLSASSTVSGSGFSTYLASPPAIGGTAAAAGTFTSLTATGNLTVSQTNGIVGTTTNNNANAGSVGEYVTASFSSVSLSTGVLTNVVTINLTAGDWDVSGGCVITASGLNVTNGAFGSSSTSATFGAAGTYWQLQGGAFQIGAGAAPTQRFSLSATTTIYMVVSATFATGTATASGILRARRVR